MPITPIAICIEDLEAGPEERFLQCVALAGRQPGLRLDARGAVRWLDEVDGARSPSAELWVSADRRLMLYRPAGAAPVRVERDGRALDVPCDKPVVLIDADQVDTGGRRLRIHIHGETEAVAPPSFFQVEQVEVEAQRPEAGRSLLHAAATALAIGAAVGASGCPKTIEVRDQPPSPPYVPPPDAGARDAAAPKPDLPPPKPDLQSINSLKQHSVKKPPGPPIEVRVRPPEPVARPDPDPPAPPASKKGR